MRYLAIIGLILLFLALPCMAYTDEDILAYASGAIAGANENALPTITMNGTALTIGRQASEFELGDMDFAMYRAKSFWDIAYTVAKHYPGRFDQTCGLLYFEEGGCYVGCIANYR
jgi:hypothetical protein